LVTALCGLVYATTYFDCGSNYPPPTLGGGFDIETLIDGTFESFVTVNGSWQKDSSGALGSVFNFTTTTDIVGNADIENGRAPATWNFSESSGACAGANSVTAAVYSLGQGVTYLNCVTNVLGGYANFVVSPNPLYSSSLPSTVTISGSGFAKTYGMPRVEYYYNDGTYVGEETAPTATSTSISAPPPSGLSSDPTGVYVGLIQNATSGGGWTTIGATALELDTPTPPNIGSGGGGGGGHCGHECEGPTGENLRPNGPSSPGEVVPDPVGRVAGSGPATEPR
jgi:hypothetical protein